MPNNLSQDLKKGLSDLSDFSCQVHTPQPPLKSTFFFILLHAVTHLSAINLVAL